MGLLTNSVVDAVVRALAGLDVLVESERIAAINDIREAIHARSPFRSEPVDFVRWVPSEDVVANGYNPNSVAPPEMRLLAESIRADGYTQPVVANAEGDGWEVVDGFHRNRVGKEVPEIRARVKGYLPIVQIRSERVAPEDRMASTIRHNRARGKHGVDEMSKIVADLARKSWTDERIAEELGMDADEVLRMKQITGLAELFADREFSKSWEISDEK